MKDAIEIMKNTEREVDRLHDDLKEFIAGTGNTVTRLADKVAELEQKGAEHFHNDPMPADRYSFTRVLKALSDPRGSVDGYEREWSDEFAHQRGIKAPPGSVWAPLNVKAVDYGSESPTSAGSSLVQTELRSDRFIDILRQRSVIMGLNPTVVAGTGNIDIPKMSTGATAYWVDGDGTAITESEEVFSTVSLTPTFCTGLVKFNYRVGLQTGGNVERIIANDLVAQIAAEIDNQLINGDGSSAKITGIINTSGVNTTTWSASPAAIAWADVLEAEKALLDDKALFGNLHYLVDPATYKALKSTTKVSSDAGAGFLADFEGNSPMLNGYPVHVSTHVPANTLIFGNFDELLVGDWGGVALASDPYTNFNTGTTGVRAMWPVAAAVRHGVSFCVATP